MKRFAWLIKPISSSPPLQRFPRPIRKQIVRYWWKSSWVPWVVTGVCLITFPVCGGFAGHLILLISILADPAMAWMFPNERVPGYVTNIIIILISAATLATAGWLTHLIRYGALNKFLTPFLKGVVDGDKLCVCLGCGYDLRGTVSRDCPECGASVYRPKRADPPDPDPHLSSNG